MTEPIADEPTSAQPAAPSLAARWRALSPAARYVVAGAALLLGVNALLAGLEGAIGRDPGGPASSSYATAPQGLAAYADLLEARGRSVRHIRTSLDRARLDPATTLVVADPGDVSDDEAAAVRRFLTAGGRLVVTGEGAPGLLRDLPLGNLEWSGRRADRATPLAPAPEVQGVNTVRAAGPGSWRSAGATLPVLAAGDNVLATVYVAGEGRVVAVADTSPWQNRLLDDADNAAFALAAAGEQRRPVAFAEAHHGFGRGEGLAALPSRWKWALAGAVLAVLVGMWARGRRLGPPEDLERDLPPPRRAYVDAMAASLVRTRRPAEAIRPLQDAARRQMARRAGLPADADDAAFRQAGARLGVPDEEVRAVLATVGSEDEVMAVGRVLARLQEERQR